MTTYYIRPNGDVVWCTDDQKREYLHNREITITRAGSVQPFKGAYGSSASSSGYNEDGTISLPGDNTKISHSTYDKLLHYIPGLIKFIEKSGSDIDHATVASYMPALNDLVRSYLEYRVMNQKREEAAKAYENLKKEVETLRASHAASEDFQHSTGYTPTVFLQKYVAAISAGSINKDAIK